MIKRIRNPQITLKQISRADLRLLRDWRNSMEIFPYSNQYFLLNMKIQTNWYNKLKKDYSRKMFLISLSKTKVGVCGLINIDKFNKNADIAILIGNTKLHGKGIGRIALSKLLEYGFKKLHLNRIGAEVIEYNKNSTHLFEKSNFKLEATFRDVIWRQNRWWNMKSFSIIRDDFLSN